MLVFIIINGIFFKYKAMSVRLCIKLLDDIPVTKQVKIIWLRNANSVRCIHSNRDALLFFVLVNVQ